MKKPFYIDAAGSVTDMDHNSIACLHASDPNIRATLVARLNLFDDLLRAVEALQHYGLERLPAMGRADVENTLAAAKLWK